MDSPVTKLIFIAAAVAASVLVVAVMWTTLGDDARRQRPADDRRSGRVQQDQDTGTVRRSRRHMDYRQHPAMQVAGTALLSIG